jgi:DNA-binding response OmpR family regulator
MAEPKKILIVEDEPDTVEWLTVFFEDHGYKTVAAYDGIQGLELTQSEKPDLITLDITMDKETGLKMYRKLCADETLSSIPVIMVTGISQDLSGFLGRKKGMREPDGFFEKPVDKEGLLKKVNELIG